MIAVFRKHIKLFFWGILILVIPSFIFLYTRGGGEDGRGKDITWGTISGDKVTAREFGRASDRESEMLRFFVTNIIAEMRYRDPGFEYWQPLRKTLAFRAQQAENSQYSRFFFVQFGQYQPFVPMDRVMGQITEDRVNDYLRQTMFPKIDEDTGEKVLDEAKYRAYMKRYDLDEDDMLNEAATDLRVINFVRLILSKRQNPEDMAEYVIQRGYYSLLWERILLTRELKKWNFVVTNREASAYTQLLLGASGKEAEQKLRDYVDARRMTVHSFRQEVEENIKLQKLRAMITSGAAAPRYDALEYFDQDNTERKVLYRVLSAEAMKSAVDIDPEVEAYYLAHKDELEEPKSVKVDYMVVQTESLKPVATVTEEDVRKEYDDNPDKYKDEAGEVLPFDDVKQDIQKKLVVAKAETLAKAKADNVLAQLKAAAGETPSGAHMQPVAEKNGLKLLQSGTISQYTKDIEQVQDPSGFITAALGADLGAVSPVIEVGNGYAILAPTEIHDTSKPSLESAAPGIARKLVEQQADEFLEKMRVRIPERYVVRYILLSRDYYTGEEFTSKVTIDEDMLKREYDLYEKRMVDAGKPVDSYEDKKESLRKEMIEREADKLFERDAAEKLKCTNVAEFDAIPAKFEPPLEIRTTGLFGPGEDADDTIGYSQVFLNGARETKVGEVSKVLSIPDKGSVVLTTTFSQENRRMTMKQLIEEVDKPELTAEDKYMLESIGMTKEEVQGVYDEVVSVLSNGPSGISEQDLMLDYVSREKESSSSDRPPRYEGVSIEPMIKVQYICIETEDIRPYLNKPFDFEIQKYYADHRSEYVNPDTDLMVPYSEAKEKITKILTDERKKSFDKEVEEYYKNNKKEFEVTENGKTTVPKLEDIRDKVAEKVTEQRLFELSRARAESLRLSPTQAAQMARYADRQGLVLRESDFFSLDDETRIDSFLTGEEEDFRLVAAHTYLGQIAARPVKTTKGFCILAPVAVKPYKTGALKPFAEAKDQLVELQEASMERRTMNNVRQYFDEQIAKTMKDEGVTFEEAAASLGLELKETGYFKMTDKDIEGFEEEERLPAKMSTALERRDWTTIAPQPFETVSLTGRGHTPVPSSREEDTYGRGFHGSGEEVQEPNPAGTRAGPVRGMVAFSCRDV